MKNVNRPIGIFDSGYGGLTVFRSIIEQLPEYDYIYLGDNARTPYGNRSFDTVLQFTTEAIRFLFERDCELIIIACNTASAKALRSIQQLVLPKEFPDKRVLGIIRPSVEALGAMNHTGSVAIWATQGTVKSETFPIEIEKYAPDVKVVQQACPMLVPMVENGELEGEGIDYFIRKYWAESCSQSSNIDSLLLACTHYPLLLPEIQKLIPPSVKILTQGDIVASSLKNYLQRHPEIESRISREESRHFLTTDMSEGFDHLAEVFLGHSVLSEKVKID